MRARVYWRFPALGLATASEKGHSGPPIPPRGHSKHGGAGRALICRSPLPFQSRGPRAPLFLGGPLPARGDRNVDTDPHGRPDIGPNTGRTDRHRDRRANRKIDKQRNRQARRRRKQRRRLPHRQKGRQAGREANARKRTRAHVDPSPWGQARLNTPLHTRAGNCGHTHNLLHTNTLLYGRSNIHSGAHTHKHACT